MRSSTTMTFHKGTPRPGPDGPLYWRNESTGQLKWIIMRFLRHDMLSATEFRSLKWYIKQWIDKTYMSVATNRGTSRSYDETMRDLAKECEAITSQSKLHEFVMGPCLDAGIDPF